MEIARRGVIDEGRGRRMGGRVTSRDGGLNEAMIISAFQNWWESLFAKRSSHSLAARGGALY
jgi:hypothetical protein